MKRDLYFKYMEDTSNLVSPLIKKKIELISKDEKSLYDILSNFYEKRFGNNLLKPTLFRLSYELNGGGSFSKKCTAIAAAFEVLNISSYQANSAFDNKLGVSTKNDVNSQFIAAMISREISEQLLKDAYSEVDPEIILEISNCISISSIYIYKAQHYDLNILSISNYNSFSCYSDFEALYIKRCHYGSGIFSGQCALAGAILANSSVKNKNSLKAFAEHYGTALHILNDLAEFFPNSSNTTKIYQDRYSDLKNGRLTLPIFLLLEQEIPMINNILNRTYNKKDLTNEDISNLQKYLIKYKIVDKCKKLIEKYYHLAKKELNAFDLTDSKRLLLTLLSVLDSNRIYHQIKSHKA